MARAAGAFALRGGNRGAPMVVGEEAGGGRGPAAEGGTGREEEGKVSQSSSQEQEQSSKPKRFSPLLFAGSDPLSLSLSLSLPSSLPITYPCTLADARTSRDQLTLETLTKIKFQVHALPQSRPSPANFSNGERRETCPPGGSVSRESPRRVVPGVHWRSDRECECCDVCLLGGR